MMIKSMIRILISLLIPLLCLGQTTGGTDADNTWAFPGQTTNTHSAGMMYVSTPGTWQITTGGTFEKLIGGAIDYTGAHLENFNESTNGRLTYTGDLTRDFIVGIHVCCESGEVTQTIQARIAENGTSIIGSTATLDFTAVNTHGSMSTFWIVELATNEYLEIFVASDQNGDDIIIDNASLSVAEI